MSPLSTSRCPGLANYHLTPRSRGKAWTTPLSAEQGAQSEHPPATTTRMHWRHLDFHEKACKEARQRVTAKAEAWQALPDNVRVEREQASKDWNNLTESQRQGKRDEMKTAMDELVQKGMSRNRAKEQLKQGEGYTLVRGPKKIKSGFTAGHSSGCFKCGKEGHMKKDCPFNK